MIHVFVGPTLSRSEPLLSGPGLRVRPPAGHGDLFDPAIGEGDTVVLIDGVFHQAPALRHKEILAALDRGAAVIGAASIGALRAAELDMLGMLGVGAIYTAYVHGVIEGDDEVAVGQAPDGGWEALTWPLVNCRHVLVLAQQAGILDGVRAAGLLEALRAVYYPHRTWAAVRAVCERSGEKAFATWLTEQRTADQHFGDLKRLDALAAVQIALDGVPAPVPAEVRQETVYFRRWSNAAVRDQVDGMDLAAEDRLLYQQVFDPLFHERWQAFLEHLSRHPSDGGPGMGLAERVTRAGGGRLPGDQLFHPVIDLRERHTRALLLAGESAADRRAVARYAAALARFGAPASAVGEDVTRRVLLQVWRCPETELDAEASARGLVNGAGAVHTAKRLIPGYLHEARNQTRQGTVAR
ncbi:TfuA-like protein [Streptomyces sp. NPDC055992]|uniref:TfuA-like protein n=1 Tax=Streptomyces sp. NPDC055992 TaxID=3345673 RepID=UPI0035D84D12